MTHTKKSRSAFEGYRRDSQWPETCGEVAKLRVARRARVTGRVTVLETRRNVRGNVVEAAGVEGSNMDARIREDHVAPSMNEVSIDTLADPRDQALSHAVLQAVLDGDYKRARRLAEEWRRLQAPDGSSRGSNRE